MIKIGYNTSPLKNGHKIRGIGNYTQNLLDELQKRSKLQIVPFENNPPQNVDVIHYPYFDLFFRSLPSNSNINRVVTIHDVIPLVFPKHFPVGIRGSINLFLQKKALKNVEAVICDSKTSKNDIIQKLSYPSDKIHVVYLAAGSVFRKIEDLSQLNKIAAKFNLPKEFILYVGDVNWNKNLKNLLSAVKIANCSLVMVGKSLADLNIPQSKEIDKQIKKLNIEKNIIKTGETGYIQSEDLAALYNLAKATISPSFYEGFGLSVLESMACGTPVICSDNSSLAEITGGLASYCNPDSSSDIAEKINNILKSSNLKTVTTSQTLINHASKFSWKKVAEETIKVYESIVK